MTFIYNLSKKKKKTFILYGLYWFVSKCVNSS